MTLDTRVDRYLVDLMETSVETVRKFKESLDTNPLASFEWAEAAIKASANQSVAFHLRAVFNSEGANATITYAVEQALRGAQHPSHSTSPVSNFCNESVVSAYAEFANRFRHIS